MIGSVPLADQLSRQCSTARDACAANALARAHQSILASVRKEVANSIPLKRQWLQKRVQQICEGRMELLATVKTIRERLGGGKAASEGGDARDAHSFDSLFDETVLQQKHPSIGATSLEAVHAAIGQRLKQVDALCFLELPPLGYQGCGETVQLFTTVMAPEGASADENQDSDSEPDNDDDEHRQQSTARTSRPSTTARDARELPPLQCLGEDAYLRTVVLPPLTVELLAEALEDDGTVQVSAQLGGPGASPSSELESYLSSVCDRLALRAALDDIRGDSKLCKRQAPQAATAATSVHDGAAAGGSACPPAIPIAAPDALPYCVSLVYGMAAQAAIAAHGIGATLEVVQRLATIGGGEVGCLDAVVLQFLLHVVFEPVHRKLRSEESAAVVGSGVANGEAKHVRELMREVRGVLRRSGV